MEEGEFRLSECRPSHLTTLSRPQPSPSRHFQCAGAPPHWELGADPWLPWGLFSACAIAEPALGYQPDKCSGTGYIFQCDGPASKDFVDLWVQEGQGDTHATIKQKWANICPCLHLL